MAAHVLLLAVSARALAESASRAGYRVTTVDAFADLDLAAGAAAIRVARFGARAAVAAALDVACDAVAYGAGFENHPRAVAALARERPLWGNAPDVLRRVRDPALLAAALARRGLPVPALRGTRARPTCGTRWLVKPRASGGGHAIRFWRPGSRQPPGTYLQEWIDGTPGSVVFAADGRRAVPLGVSRLLVGERAFGARGFRYSGNVLDRRFGAALLDSAASLATVVTEEFGLVGVNGIDFVARAGSAVAVEVNPRYTASMELVERAYGLSIFETHARSCAGELPAFDLARALGTSGAWGKAILYAPRGLVAGDTRPWLEDESIRDVPRPRARIARGRPICTVFGRGRDAAACHAALVRRAAAAYRALEPRTQRIA